MHCKVYEISRYPSRFKAYERMGIVLTATFYKRGLTVYGSYIPYAKPNFFMRRLHHPEVNCTAKMGIAKKPLPQ